MARIRSIKPEFPHSESMGRCSRDARLCFILLWTIADDSGRTRGDSRLLASLLFPYDEDSRGLIDSWIGQLESEECLVRYQHEGQTYIQITNWRSHQKIDKPSLSKLPPFDEASRIPIEDSRIPREGSSGDWIGLDRKGEERKKEKSTAVAVFPKREKKTPGKDPLRDALQESFLSKVPEFSNWGKEGRNLSLLADAIRRKAKASALDPAVAAEGVVTTFWRLHETGKGFYADFVPSKALAILESLWGEWSKGVKASDVSWMDA